MQHICITNVDPQTWATGPHLFWKYSRPFCSCSYILYLHIYCHSSKIKNTLWSESKNIQYIFTNMAFLLSLSIGHKVQDLCDIYVSFYTLKVENNKNFPRSHCQLSKLTFWNRLFISNSHGSKTTTSMKIGLKGAVHISSHCPIG